MRLIDRYPAGSGRGIIECAGGIGKVDPCFWRLTTALTGSHSTSMRRWMYRCALRQGGPRHCEEARRGARQCALKRRRRNRVDCKDVALEHGAVVACRKLALQADDPSSTARATRDPRSAATETKGVPRSGRLSSVLSRATRLKPPRIDRSALRESRDWAAALSSAARSVWCWPRLGVRA